MQLLPENQLIKDIVPGSADENMEEEENDHIPEYACLECEYTANEDISLKAHVSSVHKGKSWKCGKWPLTSGLEQMLNLYTSNNHNPQRELKRFPFVTCGKKFVTNAYVRNHRMSVH